MRVKQFLFFSTLVWAAPMMVSSLSADTWLKDPSRDCSVWTDSTAEDGETATWSGSCIEGKASGLGVMVVHDKQGLLAVFSGEMSGGKASGFGTLRFRNDDSGGFNTYLGTFDENKPWGEGIFQSSEGWELDAFFEGSFDTGEGTLVVFSDDEDGNDAVFQGEFVDGELVGPALGFYETESGETYFGDIENSKRHGVGTLIHANDDSYFGDFANGVASGTGIYESNNGAVTVGFFAEGAPNGAATVKAPNGDTYQGVFTDGKANGLVLVTKSDGTQHTENWKDGEKQE